jgi:phenylacetate-CoA ligase
MIAAARRSLRRLGGTAYLLYQSRGQAAFPFESRDRIAHVQARRVRRMVAHAYATVPYYRDVMRKLGLRPEDVRHADDLAALPLINPAQLQQDPGYFHSTVYPPDACHEFYSGGSTGQPRKLYANSACVLENAAHYVRQYAMIRTLVGKARGYRESAITVYPGILESHRFRQDLSWVPANWPIRRQYLSLHDPPDVNSARLNEFQPDVIQGFGSYLGMLFAALHASRTPFHRPRVITYSSDALPVAIRRLLTDTYGIPVVSSYASTEAHQIGFACPAHLGIHVNEDLYPVRLVTEAGDPVPPGHSGEVVISNLVNRATVLLNYRLGDLCAWIPKACPCGRTLPLLSLPDGRTDDVIDLPSGRRLHPQALRDVFVHDEMADGIWQYQVVQTSGWQFHVRLLTAPGSSRPAIAAVVQTKMKEALGPAATVTVTFVDQLDDLKRTSRGKFRAIIRGE